MRKAELDHCGRHNGHKGIRHHLTRMACAAAVMALGMTLSGYGAETEAELPEKDIVIMVTSDVHCGVEQNFGYVGLKQIQNTFEEDGADTLLVDDGDFSQGEVIGMTTKGEAVIDLMNEVGYDVVIPGNHDFDYGMDQFNQNVEEAEFPFISCNFRKEGKLVLDPWMICEAGGKKIGFVGVTTPTTVITSTPKYFQDENGNYIYDFMERDTTGEELFTAVQNAVDDVRKNGADYVFIMAHLGNEERCAPWTYANLISHISGIDGFFDGHSHDTDEVTMKDKDGKEVFRMAVGTKLNCIGCVRISAEDGSISHDVYSWGNKVSMPELVGIENELTDPIETKMEELKEELGEAIAITPYDLLIDDPTAVDGRGMPIRIVRIAETNLGDLCTDAIRFTTGAEVALSNGGAIRKSIPAGSISYMDVLDVYPFGNQISVIEVTGQQLLDALEWGARMVPTENGCFLQVSGLSYEIHTYVESSCTSDEYGAFTGVSGEYRVRNVKVGDEPLDLKKTYTVACINYILFEHGDGYTMFDGCKVVKKDFMLDNELMSSYLKDNLEGVVPEQYADPYGEGRIVAVEKPEKP